MPVDPVEVPKPTIKSLVIKNTNNENILVVEDINKKNILFRLLVWGIVKLMC